MKWERYGVGSFVEVDMPRRRVRVVARTRTSDQSHTLSSLDDVRGQPVTHLALDDTLWGWLDRGTVGWHRGLAFAPRCPGPRTWHWVMPPTRGKRAPTHRLGQQEASTTAHCGRTGSGARCTRIRSGSGIDISSLGESVGRQDKQDGRVAGQADKTADPMGRPRARQWAKCQKMTETRERQRLTAGRHRTSIAEACI